MIAGTAVLAEGESQQVVPMPGSPAPDNEPTAGNTNSPERGLRQVHGLSYDDIVVL